jgi:flagellar hook-associated protein 3 FlgL
VAALNTKQGDRYLFGGDLDDQPPFDGTGGYHGDAGVRRIELAPGMSQQVSVRADVAIKGAGGGTDVLATLQSLQTALQNNDTAGIKTTLDALDKSVSQVAEARSSAGLSMNALDAAVSAGTLARDGETRQISNLQDADVVDSATKLALAQRALEASLSASAQSFKLTLLDYLK